MLCLECLSAYLNVHCLCFCTADAHMAAVCLLIRHLAAVVADDDTALGRVCHHRVMANLSRCKLLAQGLMTRHVCKVDTKLKNDAAAVQHMCGLGPGTLHQGTSTTRCIHNTSKLPSGCITQSSRQGSCESIAAACAPKTTSQTYSTRGSHPRSLIWLEGVTPTIE